MKFNFEKDLWHQKQAVESTIKVFNGLQIIPPEGIDKQHINPLIDKDVPFGRYFNNLQIIQSENEIKEPIKAGSNIIDIMMETGTGKTYTYTQTIFELNKHYGIFKFIVIVPTLSIKAGTINFLKSDSAREHFKEQYGKTIQLHVVESLKSKKNKKTFMPPAVISFINAGAHETDSIQVMVINAGMINSETMRRKFDRNLLDKFSKPYEALAYMRPFVIIDEPHKFAQTNKTWQNIQELQPQFILRYGATFPEYENLIYQLTAVDAFANNLVKGVIGHITEFENGENVLVKLVNLDGKEASFDLIENGKKKNFKLTKKESLSKIHPAMEGLSIENMNNTKVVLSNGMELKKGDKINPFSYAKKMQELMMAKAVKNHFDLEEQLLTRDVKIKPLTLFFIDNIDEYRDKNGYLRQTLESLIKVEAEKRLKNVKNPFYKKYLEMTLQNIEKTHGGYFSKDNTGKDEAIEKEINEILHDKQAILDLNNPRRFIFSKWTLREGWDNPNVFQICKLRSSGSEISKLQEVGRGLRLPVNEYGNRVKNQQFYLNYFVDFTEKDFVEELRNEVNKKSGTLSIDDKPEKLTEEMISQIMAKYNLEDKNALLQKFILVDKIIDFSYKFLSGGFDYIKKNYPLIFQNIAKNKIRNATDKSKKIHIRKEKYPALKELWEKLNEKVILKYKFENENHFKEFLVSFFKNKYKQFARDHIIERTARLEIDDEGASVREQESVYDIHTTSFVSMKYSDFLRELSKKLHINIKTLHNAIVESKIDMSPYLNISTVRTIEFFFRQYLLYNAFHSFGIEYKKIDAKIHPTKLTDKSGNVYDKIDASYIGISESEEAVAENYLFEELFYDSELEKENIKTNLEEVIVFTKIPKNSISIPVVGGETYSPDFAYVLKFKDGNKKLYFVVESKNVVDNESLRKREIQKIKHAELLFGNLIKIKFKTQFSSDEIKSLINEILEEN